ncbi:MAG: LysR family transcriptional regulator [Burkholderiales bacterium]|nr:LysR family transcriptional regulator [Burkholderiales bacterium]
MEHLEEMMTFARVVELKSFSAAALALGTSKSLVSKQVSTLENSLGVRLLHRTTRRMSLTEIGTAYYEHCARILHEIEAAEATVTQLQAEPRGVLRMTTPMVFAEMHLAPAVQAFSKRYPKVEFDIDATERIVDLVEEGFDLAIRITDHPSPGMVAKKIASVRWVTCASPAYLKRHGTPRVPKDLLQHQCLNNPNVVSMRNGWHYRAGNKEVMVPISGNCRVNNSSVLVQMALAGMGIVLFPTYVVGPLLKSGRLKEILSDNTAQANMSLYATYLPNRYMQPKVRAFIDHLVEYFGPEPEWDKY